MPQPLTAEAITRARDLREMGASWPKVAQLIGIPQVVLRQELRVPSWPAVVTRVRSDKTATIVRTIQADTPA